MFLWLLLWAAVDDVVAVVAFAAVVPITVVAVTVVDCCLLFVAVAIVVVDNVLTVTVVACCLLFVVLIVAVAAAGSYASFSC